MDYREVVANERVLAKAKARITFSSRIRFVQHIRGPYLMGDLIVTDNYLGFKGDTKKVSTYILVAFTSVLIIQLLIFMGGAYGNNIQQEPIFIVIASIIFLSLFIPLVGIYFKSRLLSRGMLWQRNESEFEIVGSKLRVIKENKFTVFKVFDATDKLMTILGPTRSNFVFNPDFSKLDYHDKLSVLEDRYKEGAISKDLYEELKRKMPHTKKKRGISGKEKPYSVVDKD